MEESFKLKGHFEIINADTKEVLAECDNLILNVGIGLIGSRMTKNNDSFIDYIAIGNSNTATDPAQTGLLSQIFIKQMTDKDGGGTSGFFRGETLITGNEAVGAWEEFGISTAVSGGIFFNRVVKSFTHASGTNIILRFTITMARA